MHYKTAGRALARERGVRSEEFPSRAAWDSCLQDDRKGKARMICMGGGGSMDDDMVDASDGNVGGDARDEIGSGCGICMELNIVYI